MRSSFCRERLFLNVAAEATARFRTVLNLDGRHYACVRLPFRELKNINFFLRYVSRSRQCIFIISKGEQLDLYKRERDSALKWTFKSESLFI